MRTRRSKKRKVEPSLAKDLRVILGELKNEPNLVTQPISPTVSINPPLKDEIGEYVCNDEDPDLDSSAYIRRRKDLDRTPAPETENKDKDKVLNNDNNQTSNIND